jgi:hypothetical protein
MCSGVSTDCHADHPTGVRTHEHFHACYAYAYIYSCACIHATVYLDNVQRHGVCDRHVL